MNNAFLADLFSSIADRGRALLGLQDQVSDPARRASTLIDLCEQLISGRGEATGTALAREVLDVYGALDEVARAAFFSALADRFGPDSALVERAVAEWSQKQSSATAAGLHYAAEPRRQELFRRLNRAPGGTAALVAMRQHLLDLLRSHPELRGVDRDFVHLLNSWFNRGFLVLRKIDWSSPASILEKIIRYEAVHEIRDWDDLRSRIDPPDRRCYAFFHPALVDEPLIFVEVALTMDAPSAVQPLLSAGRKPNEAKEARTAVFYSISNCQQGLAGVSFGNFLIKQVVEEIRRELTTVETFVTLSPAPGFMRWVRKLDVSAFSAEERQIIESLDDMAWPDDASFATRARAVLEPLAARYFLEEKGPGGRPLDPVARFHLGNGARLERINWLGDVSEKGLGESAGIMVNYLYDLDQIEKNHEVFANSGEVVASSGVRRLWKSTARGRPASTAAAKA